MTTAGWIQLLVFLGLLVVFTPLLGGYMAKVWSGGKAPGDRVFGPIERFTYRICGIDPDSEQRWTTYTFSLLAFSAISLLFVYGFQRLQSHLPFNPDHMQAVHPDLAWNTAASFITNTNWQSYGGESTMSHLTQMAGLAVQNFASAAAGLAVLVALIRGLTRRRGKTIGNFWVDLIRTTLRILVPIAFIAAIVLASQGVVQNFHAAKTVTTDRGRDADDPGRPGREPGRDQAARHQRRRLLQHELGAPVREPQRPHEHDRDVVPHHDPVRGDVRARRAWRRARNSAG